LGWGWGGGGGERRRDCFFFFSLFSFFSYSDEKKDKRRARSLRPKPGFSSMIPVSIILGQSRSRIEGRRRTREVMEAQTEGGVLSKFFARQSHLKPKGVAEKVAERSQMRSSCAVSSRDSFVLSTKLPHNGVFEEIAGNECGKIRHPTQPARGGQSKSITPTSPSSSLAFRRFGGFVIGELCLAPLSLPMLPLARPLIASWRIVGSGHSPLA